MNVEKACIDDIAALTELRLAYLREDSGHLDASQEELIRRDLPGYFQTHLGRDLFAYVVRDGSEIVSCAFLLVIEKPMSPAFINGKTGTVLNVYTRPSMRRQGCAGKIMRKLLKDAQTVELSVIDLKATDDGYPLYRSVGFVDDQSKYRLMKWTRQ